MWNDSPEGLIDLETKANTSQATCSWLAQEVQKMYPAIAANPNDPELTSKLRELLQRCKVEQAILKDLHKRVQSIIDG